MNVFVLNTGRCGSHTFANACSHMTNFSAGHETRVQRIGPDRIDYPDNHIEVDNRLAYFLGRIDKKYGDDAYYVHLTRDRDSCARTQARHWSWQGSMVSAWHNAVLYMTPASRGDAAKDLVDTVTENIQLFLKDKTHWMPFRIEAAEEDFPKFWEWVGAEGDLDAALAEFRVTYNRTGSKLRQAPIVVGHLAQRALRFYR